MNDNTEQKNNARAVQHRRGTAAQNDAFTGLPGEITVDLDNKTIRVHDGETAGGTALARQSDVPTAFAMPFPDFSVGVTVKISAGQSVTLPYDALVIVRSGGNSCVAVKKDDANGVDLFYHENTNSNTTLSSMVLPQGTVLYVSRCSGNYTHFAYYKMQ